MYNNQIFKTSFIKFMKEIKYKTITDIKNDRKKQTYSNLKELNLLLSTKAKQTAIYKKFIQNLIPDDDNPIIQEELAELKIKMPDFKAVELLFGKYLQEKFNIKAEFHPETFKQKQISCQFDKYTFKSFVDVYHETEHQITVFEAKASTAKKFTKMVFSYEQDLPIAERSKEKEPIFFKEENPYFNFLKYNSEAFPFIQSKLNPTTELGKNIFDLAYQSYLLENNNPTNKKLKFYLIVLNDQYKYDGINHNLKELFVLIDLTDLMNEMQPIISKDINQLTEILNQKLNLDKFLLKNLKIYNNIPLQNSLFELIGYQHGLYNQLKPFELNPKPFMIQKSSSIEELTEQNIFNLLKLPKHILLNNNQSIQKESILTKKPYFNYEKIELGLQQIKYPIYYLDFETFPMPIPRHKNEKPYSQSVIQFSVHIEKEPNNCDFNKDNISFVSTNKNIDNRIQLIEQLIKAIPDDNGSIIVYYQAFEKARLQELVEIFPEYEQPLTKIIKRIFDLMHLVKGNANFYEKIKYRKPDYDEINFYHSNLNGSYSIKKVLPVFTETNLYQNLSIQNGIQCLTAFNSLNGTNSLTEQKTIQNMIEYCKVDTYSMFIILQKIKTILNSKSNLERNNSNANQQK